MAVVSLLFRRLAQLMAFLALGLAVLVAVAVDRTAAYAPQQTPPPAMMAEAVRVARDAWSSRRGAGSAELPVFSLSAATVQAIGGDLMQRWIGAAGADLRVQQGALQLGLSLPLSRWVGRPEALGWLNLKARLESQSEGLPRLVALRCGELPLPVFPWLQRHLLLWASEQQPTLRRARAMSQVVKSVTFEPDVVKLGLRSPQSLMERVRHSSFSDSDVVGLRRYHHALGDVLAGPSMPPTAAVPVSSLLVPIFKAASEAAGANWADPTAAAATPAGAVLAGRPPLSHEFRLALMAVSLYALHLDPSLFVPQPGWAVLPRREVLLRGRPDHALHFLLSAWMAMDGGGDWADLLGVYKELADAGSLEGSGFSFDDLAADRAGTELGLRAAREPDRLAKLLPELRSDDAWMPATGDLPTGLSASAFAASFGQVGSPAYQALLRQIDQRVARLAMLRSSRP